MENISIVIRFFNEHSLKVVERYLVLSSTDSGDATSITDVILAELRSTLVTLIFGLCFSTSFALATALRLVFFKLGVARKLNEDRKMFLLNRHGKIERYTSE